MARSHSSLRHRRGFAYGGLPVVLTVVAAVIVVAAVMAARWGFSSQEDEDLMMHVVKPGEFIHDITERGNIESANNIEIVCKVKPTNYSGTAIAWVAPEGTVIGPEDCLPEGLKITYEMIEKLEELEPPADTAGPRTTALQPADGQPTVAATEPTVAEFPDSEIGIDASASEPPAITIDELRKKMILVRFDSVALKNDRIQQEIVYQNSTAAVVQAQNALETAKIAKDEYIEGSYQEAVLAKKIQIKEADVEILQAKQDLSFSEKLYRKGYATKDQLENDRTKLMKAQNQLELLQKELEVLEKYTKEKRAKELEADIISAEAKWKADQASNRLDKEKLDDVEQQIANCTIFATMPGEVVYANEEGHHGQGEVVIQEGTSIRFNQKIIRLPDPTQMQVKAKISEGKISLVKVGQQVTIRLDAFSDLELTGKVKEVSEYPAGTGFFSSAVREYETIIEIQAPPRDIRPGMNAEVKIRVNRLPNVLQVPVQTIIEHSKKLYCVVRGEDGLEKREVTIGASNDKFVVIETGLEKDEKVVQNAAKYREQVGLGEDKEREHEQGVTEEESLEDGMDRQGAPPAGAPPGGDPAGKQEGAAAGQTRPDPAAIVAKIFQENDKNGNGKLEEDEVSGPMQSRFAEADTDGDGGISRQELSASMRNMMSAGGRGGRPTGGNP